jgi:hypothetical protein
MTVTKLLIGLVVFQIAALGFFGLRLMHMEARTVELAQAVVSAPGAASRAPAEAVARDPIVVTGPSGEEIRAIIREEVAALARAERSAMQQAQALPRVEAQPQSAAAVRQEIDSFIGRGRIGEAEMADLQLKIGMLPLEQRREMLNRLTKALNSGQIEGQL